METPPQVKSNQDICTIKIMFPVDSDEAAIGYKQKVTALLSEIPEARIEFALMNIPVRGNPRVGLG